MSSQSELPSGAPGHDPRGWPSPPSWEGEATVRCWWTAPGVRESTRTWLCDPSKAGAGIVYKESCVTAGLLRYLGEPRSQRRGRDTIRQQGGGLGASSHSNWGGLPTSSPCKVLAPGWVVIRHRRHSPAWAGPPVLVLFLISNQVAFNLTVLSSLSFFLGTSYKHLLAFPIFLAGSVPPRRGHEVICTTTIHSGLCSVWGHVHTLHAQSDYSGEGPEGSATTVGPRRRPSVPRGPAGQHQEALVVHIPQIDNLPLWVNHAA